MCNLSTSEQPIAGPDIEPAVLVARSSNQGKPKHASRQCRRLPDGLPCRHLRIGVMIVVIVAYVMFGPFRGDIVLVFGASAIFYVSGTFAFPVRSS